MNECPVCRTTVHRSDQTCSECGTPLFFRRNVNTNYAKRLTALFPGLGHLWLGHITTGSIALLGSFVSVFLLMGGAWTIDTAMTRLSYWVLFWIAWVFAWLKHSKAIRRHFVEPRYLARYFLVILVISNFLALFMNAYLISNSVNL